MIIENPCSSRLHDALLKSLGVFSAKLEWYDTALMHLFIVLSELFPFTPNKNALIKDVEESSLV